MPIIYCETIPIKPNLFRFIHTYYIGCAPYKDDEKEWYERDNDRLRAAIVNVGLACRALADLACNSVETVHGCIAIISDHDGRDILYKNEHDALHSLLNPTSTAIARKHDSLFSEYKRYLGRINDLRRLNNTKIVLAPRGKLVTYSGQVIDDATQ